ncbi:CDP-glycerol glycerophosphotransferase family protein [Candidatus Omnitrophota bacterium]
MSRKKTLLFISSLDCLGRLSKVIDGTGQDNPVVLGPGLRIEDTAGSLNKAVAIRAFEEYRDRTCDCSNCFDQALGLVKRSGSLPVDGDRSFEALSKYKDIIFWQVYDNTIISYYLADLIYYLKVVTLIIESEDPGQIVVVGARYTTISRIFSEVCAQRGIPLSWIPGRSLRVTFPLLPVAVERSLHLAGVECIIGLPFQFYVAGLFVKTLLLSCWDRLLDLGVTTGFTRPKGKILFYSTNAKQLDSLIPLACGLKQKSGYSPLVVNWFRGAADVAGLLKKANIACKRFGGYISWKSVTSLFKAAKLFLSSWRCIEKNKDFQRSWDFDGILLWGLVKSYLRELFLRHFVKMAMFFELAANVAEREVPRAVVVTNEREYSARLSVIAARARGISSLDLQRGAVADLADRGAPVYTDKMVVDGRFARDILIRRGVPPEKVVVAGNPRYDTLKDIAVDSAGERVYGKLGLSRDKKLIVLASTFSNFFHTPGDKQKMIDVVLAGLKEFSDCHLIIKLHPAEKDAGLYQKASQRAGLSALSIVKDIDMFDLIASCRALVTSYSTAGIEALLMDKPLITVNLSDIQSDILPYAQSGAALGVYRKEEFVPALKKILEDESSQSALRQARKDFISEHCFAFDGRATERVISVIDEMAQNRTVA